MHLACTHNKIYCSPAVTDLGYYAVLGVKPSSATTESEIRKAYLSWARKLHPDRGAGAEAEAKLARIGEAWAVLKNKKLRKVYDEEGAEGLEALDNEGGVVEHEEDDEVSGEEHDDEEESEESDEGEDGGGAGGQPSVSAFFAPPPTAAAPSGSSPQRQASSHSAKWAQGVADREVTLQIADAVAEAIKRTEERSAARYTRALAMLLQQLEPSVSGTEADERARRAWAQA